MLVFEHLASSATEVGIEQHYKTHRYFKTGYTIVNSNEFASELDREADASTQIGILQYG
jgi:hypothetical protein